MSAIKQGTQLKSSRIRFGLSQIRARIREIMMLLSPMNTVSIMIAILGVCITTSPSAFTTISIIHKETIGFVGHQLVGAIFIAIGMYTFNRANVTAIQRMRITAPLQVYSLLGLFLSINIGTVTIAENLLPFFLTSMILIDAYREPRLMAVTVDKSE